MRGIWYGEHSKTDEETARSSTHEIILKQKDEVLNTRRVTHAVNNLDFIILPLSLPSYKSLWLVHHANQLEAPVRLILRSATDADPNALTRLFDAVSRVPEHSQKELLRVIEDSTSPRTRDPNIVPGLMTRVLDTASHFRIDRTLRPVSLEQILSGNAPMVASSPPLDPSPPHNLRATPSLLPGGILFFSANPPRPEALDIEKEYRAIEDALRVSKAADILHLKPVHAMRREDLVSRLSGHKPLIVHFSGHGDSDGILARDDSVETQPVITLNALVQIFDKRNIKLVVFNSCSSNEHAKKLAEVVPVTIGTTAVVEDLAAKWFSQAFYYSLGSGNTVNEAMKDAKDTLAAHELDAPYEAYGDVDIRFLDRIPIITQ